MRKETRRLKREKRREFIQQRRKKWREGDSVERIEKPSKPERAHELGYKDKQGVVMARVKVRRGGRRKKRPNKGRRPKRMGVNKITPRENIQVIAEGRVARKFPNLEVLNSYKVGEDGKYHYYEVILLDPDHPVIENDSELSWITDTSHTGRVARGLTSSARKSRGLLNRGKGSEKSRPSKRSRR